MNLQQKLELGAKLNEACIKINETTGYTAWFSGGDLFSVYVLGGEDNKEYQYVSHFFAACPETYDRIFNELLWHLTEVEED